MNGIEIDGFDDLEEILKGMTITEQDEKRAMRKALKPIADGVEKDTPERTGKLKRTLKTTVKREDLAIVGIIRFGAFWDVFQEFGTSKSKKNVGFFERSVNKSEKKAIEILANELLK